MVSRVSSKSSTTTPRSCGWHQFAIDSPAPDALIEIRRRRDNKTILRRRIDLPPTFAFKTAEWRAPF